MSSQQLIANELLAFIQHAIDTMDEVSILQICKSNFKEEEISSGKRLLFQKLGKLDEMPSRRRDGTEKSIQDIITLLKMTDPDDVPAFVAKELHKLPPVSFDHVDVTRLLKDITFLKTTLAEVQSKQEASDNTIRDLHAEIAMLRNAVSVNMSHDASKVNMRRGAQNASICSFESAHVNASPTVGIVQDAIRPAAACLATPVKETTCASTSTPKCAYAAIVAAKQQKGGKLHQCKPVLKESHHIPEVDEDGFIKVVKKKTRPAPKNQLGTAPTGPNRLLRPAVPTTLLYVSRLHYSTKDEEIVEYIKIKTKLILRVERLESRRKVNFNSFVVRVPTEHLSTFTKEEFWPKGVVFRRFRGSLPDTARHTSPTLRVK